MRIGELSEKYGVGKDTIRYYMELELLNPQRVGGQYRFFEGDEETLREILMLKELEFTLKEIGEIILHSKLGRLTSYEEGRMSREPYEKKLKEIRNRIKELERVSRCLEERVAERRAPEEGEESGIELYHTGLLRCIECGSQLEISQGEIKRNQLVDGRMACSCGEEYRIDKGIVVAGKGEETSFRVDEEIMEEYIRETNIEFKRRVYQQVEWLAKKYRNLETGNKVILELGSGLGLFLREIEGHLEDGDIYIAVDYNLDMLRFLKAAMDKRKSRNIIYICCDFREIPIAERSVDMVVDFGGSSGYILKGNSRLLEETDKFVKEEGELLGSYLILEEAGRRNRLSGKIRAGLSIDRQREELKDLKYKLEEEVLEAVEVNSKYEEFAGKGDKVSVYLAAGKRWS